MYLIVGLGNPGKKYENTRHNVGFLFLDKLAKSLNINIDNKKFESLYKEVFIGKEKVIIIKPQTFMNLSGIAVRKFADYYNVDIENIFIIHDDLDITLGKIKLKSKGSSGGHNGLKDIEKHLGTKEYKRLKIGISKDKSVGSKEYVLDKFSSEEINVLNNLSDTILNILNDFPNLSFDLLMSKYNVKRN